MQDHPRILATPAGAFYCQAEIIGGLHSGFPGL